MARNRRKHKKLRAQAHKPGVSGVIPGTLFGTLLLLAAFSLSYLYVCGRCVALGDKITKLEKERDVARREIANEEYKWSKLMSPESMKRLMKEHGLEMIWPSEDSVVRLTRNPPPHLYAEGPAGDVRHD